MCKLASLLFFLLLAACSSSHEQVSMSMPESYTMRVSQKCFCQSELLGPFDIKVIKDKAVSVRHTLLDKTFPLRLVGDEIPSLKSMLASIERAKTRGAYQQNITWIAEPFVPKRIYIDLYKDRVDDEIDITIEDFKAL